MTVISTRKDLAELTLTLVAEFDADVERIWRLWEDPRQLERWWGPPTWPATFDKHDFTVGGRSVYHMTGPEGETNHAWFAFTAIEPPNRIELDDGFADEHGTAVDSFEPMHMTVTFEQVELRTRMTIVTSFATKEQLEQVIGMGMEEGLSLAVGQIDALLDE